MAAEESEDGRYVELLLKPLRACVNYKPSLGRAGNAGTTLAEFRSLYGADPFYHWIGLDSDLMYAAHKAAGGMTSVYRQLGIGCERLVQAIMADRLRLTQDELAWAYEVKGANDAVSRLTLDACIDVAHVRDRAAKSRFAAWVVQSAASVGVKADKRSTLHGAVFEVRQGYKSADAKRQNADMRSAVRARDDGYLFVVLLVSSQASHTVIRRYRNAGMIVLVGDASHTSATDNTFAFCDKVLGYSLSRFFERNAATIRAEVEAILRKLLSPA